MIARIVVLVVVLGVVAGCTPDDPAAGSGTEPSASTTPPPTAPPSVTRSLDPSRYTAEGTVCDLLSDAQAGELGLPSPGEPDSLESFVACTRHHALADREVDYNLWLDADVLDDTYGEGDGAGEFQPRDIGGQPAVVVGTDPSRSCRVDVALAPRKGLEILANDHDQKSCALAVTIAEKMVGNLSG